MDAIDQRIINHLQHGFPVCSRPYLQAAQELGIEETELLARIATLLQNGVLSRFGPLFHAEQIGGALTLAALSVPENRFDEIATIVNALPEIAHNYARNHTLNMWFVIATETPEAIGRTIALIEQRTGLPVFNMPKLCEYYVGLKLTA